MQNALKIYTKRVVIKDIKTQTGKSTVFKNCVVHLDFVDHKSLGSGLIFFFLEFITGQRPLIIFSKKDYIGYREGDLVSFSVKLQKPYAFLEKLLFVVLTREISESIFVTGVRSCYTKLSLLGLFFEVNREFARLGEFIALDPKVTVSFSIKTSVNVTLPFFFRNYQLKVLLFLISEFTLC